MNQFVLDSLSSSNIIIHSLEIWRFTLFARLMVFFLFVSYQWLNNVLNEFT